MRAAEQAISVKRKPVQHPHNYSYTFVEKALLIVFWIDRRRAQVVYDSGGGVNFNNPCSPLLPYTTCGTATVVSCELGKDSDSVRRSPHLRLTSTWGGARQSARSATSWYRKDGGGSAPGGAASRGTDKRPNSKHARAFGSDMLKAPSDSRITAI